MSLGLPKNLSWKRLWVPRDAEITLDAEGYLGDPEGSFTWNQAAASLEKLVSEPCLVLLGEPGIGKSRTLGAHVQSMRSSLASNESQLSVDLCDDQDLDAFIANAPEMLRWRREEGILHLFIDSIDEHKEKAIGVTKWLAGQLARWPVDRLRLRIACRTAEWPLTFEATLDRLWPDNVGVHELAPLRRRDVAQAAGAVADAFLKEVDLRDAVPLAIKPVTLDFLLGEYQVKQALPATRHELYRHGCLRLCEDPSPSRHEASRAGSLKLDQKFALASRFAAVTILRGRTLIRRRPFRGKQSTSDIFEEEFFGVERAGGVALEINREVVHEILWNTSLFSGRAEHGLGWAHQTYAEFFAAWFLKSRGLSPEEMLSELANESAADQIVPELLEVAAWLANMDDGVLHLLLHREPEVLLRADLGAVSEDVRATLVATLLERFDRDQLVEEVLQSSRARRKLSHSGIAEQIKPYILDRRKSFVARRVAIDLARACQVTALQDDLLRLALDSSELMRLRELAADAVAAFGDAPTKRGLRPLVFDQRGEDPAGRLKGHALSALWPDDLTTDELFDNLSKPSGQFIIGPYWRFIGGLKKRLRRDDLVVALRWASSLPAPYAQESYHQFNELSNAIVERAWRSIRDPHVPIMLAMFTRSRFQRHDYVFSERRQGGPDVDIGADAARRHLLVRALLALPASEDDMAVLASHGTLVLQQDIPWLLEKEPVSEPDVELRRASLVVEMVVRHLLHLDVRSAEALAVALDDGGPEIKAALQGTLRFRGIDIDSEEAAAQRSALAKGNAYKQELALMVREDHAELPDATESIKDCLTKIEAGDLDQGGALLEWLEFDPNTNVCPFDLDLTKLPGWMNADDSIRTRIFEACRTLLVQFAGSSSGDDEQALTEAAGRYLYTLAKLDSSWLDRAPADFWRPLAPVVLQLRDGTEGVAGRELVARAYAVDAQAVLDALDAILFSEGYDTHRFDVLDQLTDCWDDRLSRSLLRTAKKTGMATRTWGKLLDRLLQRNVVGAQEYAVEQLVACAPGTEAERARAWAAAHALLVHARDPAWSKVWPVLRGDVPLARQVFSKVADSVGDPRLRTAWGDKLSEVDTTELYLWLDEQFPPEEERPNPSGRVLRAGREHEGVTRFQDALVSNLISRGTQASIDGVIRIREARPGRSWSMALRRARMAFAQNTWRPRTIPEIVALQPKTTIPASADTEVLERLIQPHIGYFDVGAMRIAEGQVCLISVLGQPKGTGFLVAPDIVMTAYHVLAKVIGKQSTPPNVRLSFDVMSNRSQTNENAETDYLLAKEWLLDFSPYAPNEPDEDYSGEPSDEELDYALVRVAGKPGNAHIPGGGADAAPRRWVDITKSGSIEDGMPLAILQHPQGKDLKLSVDKIVGQNPGKTRVRYGANTQGGSSGAPCFDKHWKILALHHLGRGEYNQGVPINKIVARLQKNGKLDLLRTSTQGGDERAAGKSA